MENIFGVNLKNRYTLEAKKEIFNFLEKILSGENKKTEELESDRNSSDFFFITTLNPEILLKARKDLFYLEVLNSADLKIIDGIGVKFAAFVKKIKTPQRLSGADLSGFILEKAKQNNLKICFILKKGGLSRVFDLEKYLEKINLPKNNFQILEVETDRLSNKIIAPSSNFDKKALKRLKNKINENTEVLLVGLGAPAQEKLIWLIKKNDFLPKLKLAIGVGGAMDFWTKKQKRAPKIIQKIGLEWLWRLFWQPQRLPRIFSAVFIFPFFVFKEYLDEHSSNFQSH